MQTSSLEFYHTQSPRGLQHSTTPALRGCTHSHPEENTQCYAGVAAAAAASSRQLPLRRGWRQGPASSSQASTMSWRTALQQAMMISKTSLHDMGAAPVDPDGDRSRHHRMCSEDRLEEWRQRPACQRWPRQLFWPYSNKGCTAHISA